MHLRLRRLAAVSASFMLVVTGLAFTAAPTLAATHVINPWFGAVPYVNPGYQADILPYIASQTAAGNTHLAQAATTVMNRPTAIWLESIAAVDGSGGRLSLKDHLDNAVNLQLQNPTAPVVVTIVIYDLPGRDCAANASSNSDFPAGDISGYEQLYIDPIATLLSQYGDANPNLRFALILEPDALPNVVSNIGTKNCTTAVGAGYEEGIKYALNAFHPITNAYNYLEISNAGWLSWNPSGAAAEFNKVVFATTAKYASIDGFVTNVSNYSPVQEPYFTNQQLVGGTPVNNATYYGGQHVVDELSFINDVAAAATPTRGARANGIRAELLLAGFPASSLNFAIDTSRNGWGGPARPQQGPQFQPPSNSTDLNTFVDQSRIDRRLAPSGWCNQSGAGLGTPPRGTAANPATLSGDLQNIAAFVWVKPPGESDGTSDPSAATGYDFMCNPTEDNEFRTTVTTGALANTPPGGVFNDVQFTELLLNAYPSVGATSRPPRAPTNVTATADNTTATVTWVAPADTGGMAITSYTVTSSGTPAHTCTWTTGALSCTVTGLTNNIAYTFTVTATNPVGTGPASAASVAATPTAPGTPSYTLSVSKTGSGTVASTDGTINCGGTCTATYTSGTNVTLTATAVAGSVFTGWSACSGTGTCTVTMNAAKLVTATFTTGNGGVTVTPVIAQNTTYFTEEDVKIANTASLTALTVTIVMQRASGLSYSGEYNTVGSQITQANSSTALAITYTFTLASGKTVSAGTNWLFAGQANGTGNVHPTAVDTYTVTYTTGGVTYTQTGHF